MSQLINMSESIQESLKANVAELSGVEVLVEKQKDLQNEVRTLASKASGVVVVIGFTGNRNIAGDADGPTTESTYSITVIGVPSIACKKGNSIILITEKIIQHLHCLHLNEDQSCYHDLEYQDMKLLNNPTYLIYQIQVKARIVFS